MRKLLASILVSTCLAACASSNAERGSQLYALGAPFLLSAVGGGIAGGVLVGNALSVCHLCPGNTDTGPGLAVLGGAAISGAVGAVLWVLAGAAYRADLPHTATSTAARLNGSRP